MLSFALFFEFLPGRGLDDVQLFAESSMKDPQVAFV